jgi:nucleoside-diphosphate-sugar epimerase
MKHVIFGGDGFTGRHLCANLLQDGEEVVVCDVARTAAHIYPQASHIEVDIRDAASVARAPVGPDDVVYNLAARQYHLPVPRRGRQAYFDEVNVRGHANILEAASRRGCGRLVHFSTDMVYGHPSVLPVPVDHPRHPLGPYGSSKLAAENLCERYRNRGMAITIFRPRLILGPGRMGVLTKLFVLIRRGLPVPLIGDGSNHYQMVSVFDCVSAARGSVGRGVVNGEFNLGSKDPPKVRQLLRDLIARVESRSVVVSTPGAAVKAVLWALDAVGLTLLYQEQFAIADVNCLVDISQTEQALGWHPQDRDNDMIEAAYREFDSAFVEG